jgi:hypothetical protein
MKTISGKVIDRTWKRLNEATSEDTERLIDEMAKAQPFVLAYLMAVEETLRSEEKERGGLLLVGVMLWQVLYAENPNMHQVSMEALEEAEAANLKFIEELEAGSEMDYMNALTNLMTTYNQSPLLGAVIEALMEGNEEEPELARENVGLELLHLKTVLDCLDQ